MNDADQKKAEVTAQMLIRRPVSEVFEAFVEPSITTQFWFTKSSGRLEPDQEILWEWEMFPVSTQVRVKEVEKDKRLLIEWDEPPCPVEWIFYARNENETLVQVTTWDFAGSEKEILEKSIDLKGGFTMVLIGAKALLEHNVRLNLIADQFPDGCPE